MLCSIKKQNNFEKQQHAEERIEDKEQNSTQNCSSVQTIQDDSQTTKGIKIKNSRDKKQTELIKTLLQRIYLIQKSQNQAKQKYQKCISTLEKEINAKEVQNKKIEGEIHCLSVEIKQGKKDLQIISNYLKKQVKKSDNNVKSKEQAKINASTNILKNQVKKDIQTIPLYVCLKRLQHEVEIKQQNLSTLQIS